VTAGCRSARHGRGESGCSTDEEDSVRIIGGTWRRRPEFAITDGRCLRTEDDRSTANAEPRRGFLPVAPLLTCGPRTTPPSNTSTAADHHNHCLVGDTVTPSRCQPSGRCHSPSRTSSTSDCPGCRSKITCPMSALHHREESSSFQEEQRSSNARKPAPRAAEGGRRGASPRSPLTAPSASDVFPIPPELRGMKKRPGERASRAATCAKPRQAAPPAPRGHDRAARPPDQAPRPPQHSTPSSRTYDLTRPRRSVSFLTRLIRLMTPQSHEAARPEANRRPRARASVRASQGRRPARCEANANPSATYE